MGSATRADIKADFHPTLQVDAMLAQQHALGWASTGTLLGGIALFLGGLWTLVLGQPAEPPTSPALLPALKESRP
jgi:hypothetical protein